MANSGWGELLAAVHALDPEDNMALPQAAELGRNIEARLADPRLLMELGEFISGVARRHGCEAVKGASVAGMYLATAAVTADGDLTMVTNGGAPPRVLVVDHVLVTGYALRSTALDLHAAGATSIYGCVLTAMPDVPLPEGLKAMTLSTTG